VRSEELGLFPLELALLPGEQVPLHIFEPRYRELIGECLDERREFGLVLAEGDELREIGTRAAVVEVLERLQDGSLNVVVEGGARFRLVEETSGRSFRTGIAQAVEDADDPAPADERRQALELFRELRTLLDSDVEDPNERVPLSFALAARVDFGSSAKQQLLETTSERERLELMRRLLRRAVQKTRAERARREVAARNGRPPDVRQNG
jgi:ATP-dependent Lon protease